jgi:D-alanine-D-alanine ligase
MVRYSAPPRDALRREVEALALESYRVLECRDAGRVDVRCDGRGRPAFLEVNPLPGIHPTHSDLPMIATQEGMSYPELIGAIIDGAAERLGLRHET